MPAPRKCIVDATSYEYCPRCGHKTESTETWRSNFCSENCRDIYNTVNAYTHKKITVGQAKSQLDKCDLIKLPEYADAFKLAIVDIMANDTPAPIVETPVVEETPVEETVEETTVEPVEDETVVEELPAEEVSVEDSEQPVFRRKRRR